ncbi:hypothetical protein K443DRAFT_109108 [Laccaria amethystina LaAM-08-1]|uniref:Uncharacterized protein n=1 Tax=Laccaria amethystina LaAM-08-1 TaxID=1095629 RepID=A0A0C9X1P2_9AGAR|nr:hypothetical protein K443DRAFT_109108 [Laccaria amethystina LaAM-08-1]
MLSLLSSVILVSAVGFASASDICTYTSRSCIGSYGCCYGIAQNTCCYWPSNYGWSVKFQNMPMTSTWLGETFGDSICSTETSGQGSSSGSICDSVYNSPTYLAYKSANWHAGTGARRDLETRDNATCVQPNVIGFTTEDGKEHLVKVPEGKFDEVNEWVKTDDYSKLLELDSV